MRRSSTRGEAKASRALFPRATSTFVGRKDELERVLALAPREVLFLVYGAPGIGKSEFVYKVVERLRERPAFSPYDAIDLRAGPETGVPALLATLRRRLGQTRASAGRDFEAELAETAELLEARPALVFLDDMHGVDPAVAVSALGYFSRHVRASRVFLASRVELPVAPGRWAAVMTRLPPLDLGATRELVLLTAERLGLRAQDIDGVVARTGGRPLLVERELAQAEQGGDLALAAAEDDLSITLRDLQRTTGRALLMAVEMRGRLAVHELLDLLGEPASARPILDHLARSFLVDVQAGTVLIPEFVRQALLSQVSDEELREARRAVADLLVERYEGNPRENRLDGVEAIHQLARLGEHDEARSYARHWYRGFSAAGVEAMLLGPLSALRAEGIRDEPSLELMSIRTLMRAGHLSKAKEALGALGRPIDEALASRYDLVESAVFQRTGELGVAARAAERVLAATRSPTFRFRAALQLANVHSLRGESARARTMLDDALGDLGAASARERVRYHWSTALTYLMEEAFQEAILHLVEGRRALGEDAADLASLLTVSEAWARVEDGDLAGARSLWQELCRQGRESHPLRRHEAALCAAALAWGEGDVARLVELFRAALLQCDAHGDVLHLLIVADYLARGLLSLGDLGQASEVLATAADRATPDLFCFSARLGIWRALVQGLRGDVRGARSLAKELLRGKGLSRRGRFLALGILARVAAKEGDLPAARSYWEETVAEAEACHELWPLADLERAELELCGGDAALAVRHAERALAPFATGERLWLEARAAAAVAAAHLMLGTSGDGARAASCLARALELATARGYRPLAAFTALLQAAEARARHDPVRAREVLAEGAQALRAADEFPESRLLRAAVTGEDLALPGLAACLHALGLDGRTVYEVLDRGGARRVGQAELERVLLAHELVVDMDKVCIRAKEGGTLFGSRLACALLTRLVRASGAVVDAETLFRDVWKGTAYHPLRHRNTVHVGITRLRRMLRDVLPATEVVATMEHGWRLAENVAVCVVRALPG